MKVKVKRKDIVNVHIVTTHKKFDLIMAALANELHALDEILRDIEDEADRKKCEAAQKAITEFLGEVLK